MKLPKKQYICQECKASFPKWQGRCDTCGAWNTLTESVSLTLASKNPPLTSLVQHGTPLDLTSLQANSLPPVRYETRITELDRVLGGGFVEGSAVLVAGDPGIGKSTLLLQSFAKLSEYLPCLYVSGEESIAQLQGRAVRLGLSNAPLQLAVSHSVHDILSTLMAHPTLKLAVIDSIQTVALDSVESSAGSVAQVRASAHALVSYAKRHGITLVLVGHVTREGQIAGPRVLEHMVDAVLYFEGEKTNAFRILRAVKNRYGATDEIGVFGMGSLGLEEISNPSSLFLNDTDDSVSGSCVFAGMEGTRPLLVEIQSLIVPSTLANPRRSVVGADSNRLSMIVAILEARAGLSFAMKDIFFNVAGGLRISEPALDLAMASALVSALSNKPLPSKLVACGELSLSGQVRRSPHLEKRFLEAKRLGFSHFLTSPLTGKSILPTMEVSYIQQLLPRIFSSSSA